MKIIELEVASCKTVLEVYEVILRALDAPEGHGRSLDALEDSMIWADQINKLKPPYIIRILGAEVVPASVREEIKNIERTIKQARIDYRKSRGRDVEVTLETDLKS